MLVILLFNFNVLPDDKRVEGLVSWWDFDENVTIAKDRTGNNYGEIYGSPERAPLKVGSCLSFDGKDDYVEIPETLNLLFERLCVMLWVVFWEKRQWRKMS